MKRLIRLHEHDWLTLAGAFHLHSALLYDPYDGMLRVDPRETSDTAITDAPMHTPALSILRNRSRSFNAHVAVDGAGG